MGAEKYQSMTILSQFSLAQLLFEIQRDQARKWEQEKVLLESVGIDPKSVQTDGSDELVNEFNLSQLKKEQQLQAIGSTIEISYRANRVGVLELKKYLRVLHCLVGGLAVDDYHLMRYGTFPKLPSLIANLLTGLSEYESKALLDILVAHYRNLADVLTKFDSIRVPSVMLAMSKELTKQTIAHPQATELVNIAVANWLQIRQIEAGANPFDAVEQSLTIADIEFVINLNQCLKELGQSRQFDVSISCFQRGVRRNHLREYGAARSDFDQVISINPHADAYLQRGYACLKLEDYISSIKDFDQAAMLQSQRVEIYEYRGNAYLGLNKYETALANYNQAIFLGSSNAVDLRDRLQNWLDNERSRQHKERRQALIMELPNSSDSLELVWIPAGELNMECGNKINLAEFRMSKYPITQAQYQSILGMNSSKFKNEPSSPNHPVDNVSWSNAVAFCNKLSELTGEIVRLPSETEWEYACRSGSTRGYYFDLDKSESELSDDSESELSDDSDFFALESDLFGVPEPQLSEPQLSEYAWFSVNSGSKTHPVGQKTPNNFGLYDMYGNVAEWCGDNWTDNLNDLQKDGSPLTNGGNSSYHPLRGGAWCYGFNDCSSTSRIKHPDSPNAYWGFRIVVMFKHKKEWIV